jgi:hypothetical protein
MDGPTDRQTKDQKYDISFFMNVALRSFFSFRQHKSRFYEGGTNVVFLAIGGTNVDFCYRWA